MNQKRILKIALLQIAPGKTLEDNLEKGIEYCQKAKEKGADIALFPEMWSNGYNIYNRSVREWKKEAIPVDSAFVQAFGSLAKRLNMEVISEGVETKDQVDFLTEIDCHMVQGYYFSKPMPMQAYEAMWYSDLESARAEAAADNASETPEASETPVVPETAQPESAAE